MKKGIYFLVFVILISLYNSLGAYAPSTFCASREVCVSDYCYTKYETLNMGGTMFGFMKSQSEYKYKYEYDGECKKSDLNGFKCPELQRPVCGSKRNYYRKFKYKSFQNYCILDKNTDLYSYDYDGKCILLTPELEKKLDIIFEKIDNNINLRYDNLNEKISYIESLVDELNLLSEENHKYRIIVGYINNKLRNLQIEYRVQISEETCLDNYSEQKLKSDKDYVGGEIIIGFTDDMEGEDVFKLLKKYNLKEPSDVLFSRYGYQINMKLQNSETSLNKLEVLNKLESSGLFDEVGSNVSIDGKIYAEQKLSVTNEQTEEFLDSIDEIEIERVAVNRVSVLVNVEKGKELEQICKLRKDKNVEYVELNGIDSIDD